MTSPYFNLNSTFVNCTCSILSPPTTLAIPSSNGEEVLKILKIVLILVLSVGNFGCSLLPWGFKWFLEDESGKIALSLGLSFSSGIIIGVAFSHIIPDSEDSFSSYFDLSKNGNSHVYGYPYTSLIMIGTFLILLWVEWIGKSILGKNENANTNNISLIVNFEEKALKCCTCNEADPMNCCENECSNNPKKSCHCTIKTSASPSLPKNELQLDTSNKSQVLLKTYIFWVAMSLHGLLEGLGVGAVSKLSAFWSIFIGMIIHKGFDGYAIGASIDKLQVHFFCHKLILLILCAVCTPIGVCIGWVATVIYNDAYGSIIRGVFFAMTGGALLYIGVWELLRECLSSSKMLFWKLLFLTLGWSIMVIIAIWV